MPQLGVMLLQIPLTVGRRGGRGREKTATPPGVNSATSVIPHFMTFLNQKSATKLLPGMEYNEIKQINVATKYITIRLFALKKVSLELEKTDKGPIILKEIFCLSPYYLFTLY